MQPLLAAVVQPISRAEVDLLVTTEKAEELVTAKLEGPTKHGLITYLN